MWPLYVQTAMTEHIKTGTTESLGISLTAQDVADAIVKAVEPSWLRRAIHQVHFPVGSQTKAGGGVAVLTRVADPAGQQTTRTLRVHLVDNLCDTMAVWRTSTSPC